MLSLDELARDIQLSNPHLSTEQIKSFLEHSRRWEYPWGIIFAVGNDIHMHVLTDYRRKVYLRPAITEAIKAMFVDFDKITSGILKVRGKRLVKHYLKMGWNITGETEQSWKLEMTKEGFTYA